MFTDLIGIILEMKDWSFDDASSRLVEYIDRSNDFIDILKQIGTIPEQIAHDSTEEKLFSKASDAVLARAFRTLGLQSVVLKERGDSADVIAQSHYHGYTLVADAKAFRMSRTAKNQKDFKVTALSSWRQDHPYAVLCAPYYQYPSQRSQIFAQALEKNVCLFSWEHMLFLISNGISETEKIDLSTLWNYCGELSQQIVVAKRKVCFIPWLDRMISLYKMSDGLALSTVLAEQIELLKMRGEAEKEYWIDEMNAIRAYSREQAIQELIIAKKIQEKIAQINSFIEGLNG